ncbi:MAG: LiaF-related protein [Candidatus Dojkabacteria bacterium]|jgi:hypothetical protein|nr:LiaF-related protein [Candidatus Dojkabacteria bacterium]
MENKRNYSWAVFLVLVGILFLLNTTGLVGWGIWEYIVRFWPVMIILLGIKIILGNSVIAKTLEIIITIILTVGVFGLAYIQYTANGISFLPKNVNDWVLKGGSGMFNISKDNVQNEMSVTFDEYTDIEERDIKIYVGAGKMSIEEDSEIEDYFFVSQDYPRIYKDSELTKSEKEGVLSLDFKSASPSNINLFPSESIYDITLGQLEIPTTFDIEIGAGSGMLDLQTLPVNDFYAKIGAGELDATFSKYSIPSGEMFFNVGAGKMELTIPSSIGYIFEYDLGVGKINIDGKDISDFSTGTGKYTSPNYDEAQIKITMNVNVGVGSFILKSN